MISKKKGLHFDSVSNFTIILPKLWRSLKKKSLHFHSDSNFAKILPKSRRSLKKWSSLPFLLQFHYNSPKIMAISKKKVFTSISFSFSLFFKIIVIILRCRYYLENCGIYFSQRFVYFHQYFQWKSYSYKLYL